MAAKNDATVPAAERLPFHFLFTKSLQIYENWRKWLEAWGETENVFQLISMLHDGFNVSMDMSQYGYDSNGRYRSDLPVYDGIDRLIFYFEVAEGWRDSNILHKPGDELFKLGKFWFDSTDRIRSRRHEHRRPYAPDRRDERQDRHDAKDIDRRGGRGRINFAAPNRRGYHPCKSLRQNLCGA